MPTSISRLSKPDTVFLCEPAGAGAAALADDVSQYRTDLTNATTYVHETPSARTAITYPRNIAVVLEVDDSDVVTAIEHGDGLGDYTYQIVIDGGSVFCNENGDTRVRGDLPGADGTVRRFLVAWSTRADGSDVRSELLLVNLGDQATEFVTATHVACTTDATHRLVINDGGGLPVTRYRTVRIGRRFVTTTEAWEDFVSETTAPTVTQVRRGAPLVPDRDTLDIASDGSFAGPCYLWAGHAFEESDRRLVSPLVNVRVFDPLRISNAYAPAAWWRLAPGSSTMRLCTALLWYRPVSPKVNRARVRLFVRQTIEVGTETAEVSYRVYSLAGLPLAGEPAGPLTWRRTAAATCSTHHGAAPAGEWLDLGEVALERDSWGCTWLAVGVEMDEDSPLVADTRAHVHAVTVEPYSAASGGGLDILNP